jgi:hypothetical protein
MRPCQKWQGFFIQSFILVLVPLSKFYFDLWLRQIL